MLFYPISQTCTCILLDVKTKKNELEIIDIKLKKQEPKAKTGLKILPAGCYIKHHLIPLEINIKNGYKYVYNAVYKVKVVLNNTKGVPCDPKMNWKTERCRLLERVHEHSSRYNCTPPWLIDFARYLNP